MGMGGGGSGGAIGAHVHDNNAGQGGNLTVATLLNVGGAVTLESRFDNSVQTQDTLTADETTTSTSYVASGLSLSVPDDDKLFLHVASICSSNSSIAQNVYSTNGFVDNAQEITVHNATANFRVDVVIVAMGTQTGQTLSIAKRTSVGTMTTFGTGANDSISNLQIFAVGA